MNISPVSFGNNAAFHEMISRPQAFATQSTAVASTPVEEKPKKKGGLKKLLAAVAVAGAAVAGIVYGAKKGVFKVDPEKGNKVLNTVKGCLDRFGNAVAEFVSKHAGKAKQVAQEVVEEAPKA